MYSLKSNSSLTHIAIICVTIIMTTALSFSHGDGEPEAQIKAKMNAKTQSQSVPDVLVVINNDSVTTADLDREIMKSHNAFSSMENNNVAYEYLLNKFVNDILILQEAYSIGMEEEDWIQGVLKEKITKRSIGYYVKDFHNPDISATDEELNKFFEDYYFRFQISTISSDTKEMSDSMYNLLTIGLPFDSLATEHSIDSRRYKGGQHKLKYYADTDTTLRNQAMLLTENEVSKPFKFLDGFIVLRLDQKLEPIKEELSILSRKLTGMLQGARKEELWNKFVDSLISLNDVNVVDAVIEKINKEGTILFTDEFLIKSDTVAITINDTLIFTETDLRNKISHTAMSNGDKPIAEITEIALKDFLTENVLNIETLKKNYDQRDEVVTYYYKTLDSILIENYLVETVVNKITFNQQEFNDYYADSAENFREPAQYQFEQLQFTSEDSAKFYFDRLNSGSDFKYIKKLTTPNYVDEPTDKEWSLETILPAYVKKDVGDCKPGQAIGPYSLSNGWLVLYLLDSKQGKIKPYAEVFDQIKSVFFNKIFKEKLDEHLEILKANSDITYYDEKIENYFK